MRTNPLIAICLVGVGAVAGVVAMKRSDTPRLPAQSPTTIASVNPLAGQGGVNTSTEPIRPIVSDTTLDPQVVALGRRLFEDPRLSADDTISCSSCHDLDKAGADGRAVSIGIGGAVGDHNAPTVLNCGLNFRQFWDGRAASLEEQAGGPITNPKEMGSTWPQVLAKLRADPAYVRAFAEIYNDGVTEDNIRNAIATFERSLTTPGSRFDRYLEGDLDAITAEEVRGYELFLEIGCASCHQGMNVGGNLFQRFGVASNFFEDRGDMKSGDLGRFNVTGEDSDRFRFKVPSLRNASKTAPYFHDGSVATLEQAVRIMAQYQLGIQIDSEDTRLIAAFIRTLEATHDE